MAGKTKELFFVPFLSFLSFLLSFNNVAAQDNVEFLGDGAPHQRTLS